MSKKAVIPKCDGRPQLWVYYSVLTDNTFLTIVYPDGSEDVTVSFPHSAWVSYKTYDSQKEAVEDLSQTEEFLGYL